MTTQQDSAAFAQITRERVDTLRDEVTLLSRDVRKLQNHLPPWATMIIAFLTAALGYCAGFLAIP